MNLIAECTKDCARDDCSISIGASMTTLMGWTPTYDKRGNRTDRGDPNTTTTELRCRVCGRHWVAATQRGETKIVEAERAAR